jgi:hypothetical protein
MTCQCGISPFCGSLLAFVRSERRVRRGTKVARMTATVRRDGVLIAPVGAVVLFLRHYSS